ncbi:hypothetical protein O3G_MSEX010995, partial [Manduca sexta]
MAPIVLSDPVVQSYILYSAILTLKLLSVTMLTSRVRYSKKVFANEEDAKAVKGKIKFDDPDVEKVRRSHLNDLENIPAFWLLGALYLTTSPWPVIATLLFRVYTAFRILYTIVYAIIPLPHPARSIAFGIPYVINVYMGVQVILHYL